MNFLKQHIRKKILLIILLWVAAFPVISQASLVTMQTSLGPINIELFDDVATATVNNFMNYVNDGDYDNSFFHRKISGFILQGGGFSYDSNVLNPFDFNAYPEIPTDAPVANEFDINRSNVRGTLAMAKLGGDPDSATSQWFFNLVDNSLNLDNQNGGFTVFGQVTGNGMDIVDAIAALQSYNIAGVNPAFSDVPLIGEVTSETFDPVNQLVMVNSISAVPVPAAAWLFGSGLIGLIGLVRRKRHIL